MSGAGWFLYRQIEEIRARGLRSNLTATRARLALSRRVVDLENELAHVSLITFALADLCLEKGHVTHDEMQARMAKIDADRQAAAAAEASKALSLDKRRPRRRT